MGNETVPSHLPSINAKFNTPLPNAAFSKFALFPKSNSIPNDYYILVQGDRELRNPKEEFNDQKVSGYSGRTEFHWCSTHEFCLKAQDGCIERYKHLLKTHNAFVENPF